MDIEEIKKKEDPSEEELNIFCKHFLDNHDEDTLMSNIPEAWDQEDVKRTVRDIKLSNRPPVSKKNYTSLGRKPLEDPFSR